MKILFVAYCFGSFDGQALIGVYKRGLRLAMELRRRGHRVLFYCTGREAYQDELTRAAERELEMVDIPWSVAAFAEAGRNRRRFLEEVGRRAPDLIVLGEAPLSGAMLEATLAGAELGIPVVFLDNAYNPLFVEIFLGVAGPMADGIVLMGPSSHHLAQAPPHLCQVPPLCHSAPKEARGLLADLGLAGERLVTVLAYDAKVERLGLSLLPDLCRAGAEVVFCSRDPARCLAEARSLAPGLAGRVRAVPPQPEPRLLGLLEISRLAVVKYGFMQVAECLALRTPAIVVYHEGPTWLDYLPAESRRFARATASAARDRGTVEAALGFLGLPEDAMAGVHSGKLDAIPRAASFLEALPRAPRTGTAEECAALGFTGDLVREALARRSPRAAPDLRWLRALRLRVQEGCEIYSVLCGLEGGRAARLWGRRYATPEAARAERRHRGRRRVLVERDLLVLEEDRGQALLPELNP